MLKNLSGFSKKMISKTRSMMSNNDTPPKAVVVSASDHIITPKLLSANAKKVLRRINEGGYAAYLVGGGVRDALVGLEPKDFDVATDASPEQVKELFRNSRIIGRRFRLVHVVFGRDIIEVATFRASHDKGDGGEIGESGRIVRDNVFGSIEEDALRRDFSVNALYYDLSNGTVIDYAGGLDDIENKVFRLIGDPVTRCEEDPVRVLRAVRLASKLEFSIEPATLDAMSATAATLAQVPAARMFEEVLKLFQGGYAHRSFQAIRDHDLLQYLFPLLAERLESKPDPVLETLLGEALANTDKRVAQKKPITPYYLLAFMLWPDVEERAKYHANKGVPVAESLKKASDEVMAEQLKIISIPKRFSGPMREIWHMQPRLEQWRGARSLKLMENRRFRAAYDFLCLRSSIDPRLHELADWWTSIQEIDEPDIAAAAQKKPVVFGIWSDTKPSRRKKRKPRRAGQEGGKGGGKGKKRAEGKTTGEGQNNSR